MKTQYEEAIGRTYTNKTDGTTHTVKEIQYHWSSVSLDHSMGVMTTTKRVVSSDKSKPDETRKETVKYPSDLGDGGPGIGGTKRFVFFLLDNGELVNSTVFASFFEPSE